MDHQLRILLAHGPRSNHQSSKTALISFVWQKMAAIKQEVKAVHKSPDITVHSQVPLQITITCPILPNEQQVYGGLGIQHAGKISKSKGSR
jgi:hypothetical protein